MDNTQIENNIYFELSCLPDQWIPFDSLNTIGASYHIHNTICENLPSKFEFIQIDKINRRLKFINKTTVQNALQDFFAQTPSEQNFYDLIDDINTIGHLICQNERLDLLKLALKHPNFNPDRKNKNGQSIHEMIPQTDKGKEMQWLLKKHTLEQTILELENSNKKIRMNNAELYDKHNTFLAKLEHQCSITTLYKDGCTKATNHNKILTNEIHEKEFSIKCRNIIITILCSLLCFMYISSLF